MGRNVCLTLVALFLAFEISVSTENDDVRSTLEEHAILINRLLATIQKQEVTIDRQARRISKLENEAAIARKERDELKRRLGKPSPIESENGVTQDKIVKRQVNSQNAFYAFMSSNLVYPKPNRHFIFDVVKTSVGSGYNKSSGQFIAPDQGTFVFTWNVVMDSQAYAFTELVVNTAAFGNIVTDSQMGNEYHMSTGTAVVRLNQNDIVFVRTNPNMRIHGNILSANSHRTSFAGWQIY